MSQGSGEANREGHRISEGKEIEVEIIFPSSSLRYDKVSSLIPPGGSFQYWTIKYSKGEVEYCHFFSTSRVYAVVIKEK